MTRQQRKKLEEKIEAPISNKPISQWSDQPRVVELLKIPGDFIELTFISKDQLENLKRKNDVYVEKECFVLNKNKNIIYINLNYRAQFSRDEFVTKLEKFCKEFKIKELCIVK